MTITEQEAISISESIDVLESLRTFATGCNSDIAQLVSSVRDGFSLVSQLHESIRTAAGIVKTAVPTLKQVSDVCLQVEGAAARFGEVGAATEQLLSKIGESVSGRASSIPDAERISAVWPSVQKLLQSCSVSDKHNGHVGSQCEEDSILGSVLPRAGTYIDIGAGCHSSCSNTFNLWKNGWRGLLVEPQPKYALSLALHRTGDFVLPVAVSDHCGLVSLRLADGCSSIVETWDIQEHGVIVVPCLTVPAILEKYPQFAACDFCSIDAEGSEQSILSSIDWSVFKPGVMSVENIEYHPDRIGDDVSGKWIHFLTDNGYAEIARTQFNIIFKRTASA